MLDNNKLSELIDGNYIRWEKNNREEIEIFCQIKKYQVYDYKDSQNIKKQITFTNGDYLWINNNNEQIKANFGDYISYNQETLKFEINKINKYD